MPHIATLLGFALVSLGLVLTPGPNMITDFALDHAGTGGGHRLARRRGARLRVLHAVRGVRHHGALFAVPFAYDALRFSGAAYLLWLAWQAVKPGGRSPFQVKKLPSTTRANCSRWVLSPIS